MQLRCSRTAISRRAFPTGECGTARVRAPSIHRAMTSVRAQPENDPGQKGRLFTQAGLPATIKDATGIEIAISKLNRLKLVQLFQSVFIRRYKTNTTELRPPRVSLANFKSNLRQITRIAAENGIIPVLITAPSSHVKGEEPQYLADRGLTNLNELVPLHQEYVGAAREVASEEGVHLIDLAEEFDKLFQEYPLKRQLCFKNDGIHAAPAGDQIIADLIYDYFQRHDCFNQIAQ